MNDLREKIWNLYHSRGLPLGVIGGWALPEPDTRDLLAVLLARGARKVLEIGSYIGITTNLMASLLPDDARIHAIDPNQPLHVEDMAMVQAQSGGEMRPFELGSYVARALGVSHKIHWHEGGSTTGKTFATENGRSSLIPVIGDHVCHQHGPFDFIFIDALHYEFAVQADLELAARSLAENGVIAVHDVLGRWGSHVRRAVYHFLAEHPDFRFVHFPYSMLNHAMGYLTRRGEESIVLPTTQTDPAKGIWQPPMVDALCAWITGHLGVQSIVSVGPDPHRHTAVLASHGHRVTHVALEPASGCDHLPWDEKGALPPLPSANLCICLHAALPRCNRAEELTAALCACSSRVLFSATPPGEAGAAHENALPWDSWLRLFAEQGFMGSDAPLQQLEPWLFKIYNNPTALANSYGIHTWLFEHSQRPIGPDLIKANRRLAGLTLDALAANLILADATARLQNAGAREEEWTSWKKLADERELQWIDWKKQADERELQWLEERRRGSSQLLSRFKSWLR